MNTQTLTSEDFTRAMKAQGITLISWDDLALAEAIKALAESGPKPDMPTDADLIGHSLRYRL